MESLFFSFISLLGFSLFYKRFNDKYLSYLFTSAFPLGLAIMILFNISILFIHPQYKFHLNILFMICMTSFQFFKIFKINNQRLRFLKFAFLNFFCVFMLSYIACRLSWVQLSFDSIEQIAIGRYFNLEGLSQDSFYTLSTWGIVIPIIQGMSVWFHQDLIYSLQILIAFSIIAQMISCLYFLLPQQNYMLILLPIAFLISTDFFVFQSAYIHNSFISSLYLLMTFTAGILSKHFNEEKFIPILILNLLIFSICRTESILFSTLIMSLMPLILKHKPLIEDFKSKLIYYLIIIISWQIFLVQLIGQGSDIMTPTRLILLSSILCISYIYVYFGTNSYFYKYYINTPNLIILMSTLFIVICGIYDLDKTYMNFKVFYKNFILFGRWGVSWVMILLLSLFIRKFTPKSIFKIYLSLFMGFVCMLILFSFGRTPYRLGWGDSSNRIFMHLFPLYVFLLSYGFFNKKLSGIKIRRLNFK